MPRTPLTGLSMLAEAIDARFAEPFEVRQNVAAKKYNPRQKLAEDVAELTAAFVRDNGDRRIDDIVAELSRGAISSRDGVIAAIRVLAEQDVLPDAAGLDVAAVTSRRRR